MLKSRIRRLAVTVILMRTMKPGAAVLAAILTTGALAGAASASPPISTHVANPGAAIGSGPGRPNGPQGTGRRPTAASERRASSTGITGSQIVANAWNWFISDGNPPYSESCYWHSRTDYCGDGKGDNPTPTANPPSWREDCSGFVSYTWQFADSDGGFTTYDVLSYSKPISWSQLQPGDALLLNGVEIGGIVYNHIGLFMGWNANGTYNVMDETQPGTGTQYQTDIPGDDGFWQYAQPIQYDGFTSPPPGGLVGGLTYAPGSNGSVQEMFGHSASGTVYENWEVSGGAWHGWHSLGGDITSDLTDAPGTNGSLQELFGVGPTGTVYENWENTAGTWHGWHSLGGDFTSSVTYAPGTNGAAQELWAINRSGTVYESWENSSGAWSGWAGRGGALAGDVTFAPGTNTTSNVQEMWAHGANGTVFENWTSSTGGWAGWHNRGGDITSKLTYAPGTNGSLQEIWGRNNSGTIYESWQNPGGTWSGWDSHGGTFTGDVTYAPGTNTTTSVQEMWAHGANGTVFETWENSSGVWHTWANRGGHITSDLTYAPGSNASLQEIWGLNSGTANETWENTNGAWTRWTNRGS
jgi:hypothetical protein